jgi:hypothetical protein
MSERTPFEKAEFFDLNVAQVKILYRVTAWFNRKVFKIHDKKVSIASRYEPTLKQLCTGIWEPEWSREHQELIERGLFKSPDRDEDIHICGRRCEWLPTEDCLQVIESIFDEEKSLYPRWILDEHTGPPTFRDGNELLAHRKGVCRAAHLFGQLERVTSTDLYPSDQPDRADLWLSGSGEILAQVEVLTNHNNRDTWTKKFVRWRDPGYGPTIWIFTNRESMVQFWNHLQRHGYIELDGGMFGRMPSNWSPTRVNDRLQRSRKGPMDYKSHDLVLTLGGLMQAGKVRAFELFDDYDVYDF